MRPGLLLCAFGLHRWRMEHSQRQCERCQLLQGYNRLGPLTGESDWYEIDLITGKAKR